MANTNVQTVAPRPVLGGGFRVTFGCPRCGSAETRWLGPGVYACCTYVQLSCACCDDASCPACIWAKAQDELIYCTTRPGCKCLYCASSDDENGQTVLGFPNGANQATNRGHLVGDRG